MYYGKKKWIIIAIVVIILILAIAGVGLFLFLKTDLFKSNSDLFYKYMGEQLMAYKSANDTQMQQVEDLKQIKPYTVDGRLTVNYENDESDEDLLTSALENLQVKVNGKYDKANEIENTTITVVNGTQDLFVLDAARTEDVYALKSNEVVENAYVGIKTENLKVLAQKLGFGSDVSQVLPDNIEQTSQADLLQITDNDIQHIQEMYAPILSKILKDSNFSKQNGVTISNENKSYTCNSYRLDLSGTELKNIVIAILEQLQTDSITLNLISTNAKALGLPDEYAGIESITALIETLIEGLQETEIPEEGISIVVYESDGKAICVETIVKNQFKITVFNNVNNNSMSLNIKIENLSAREDFYVATAKIVISETPSQTIASLSVNVDDKYSFEIMYESDGAATTDSIQNTLSVTIGADGKTIVADYEEDVEFTDSIPDIIELDNSNTAILNDYTTEQLSSFIPQVRDRVIEVFFQKVLALGIPAQGAENQLPEGGAENGANQTNENQPTGENTEQP